MVEGEIIWNHIEGEEIEILIRITEIKEIGIQMGMNSEIKVVNPILKQEKITIIKKSFILKNCKIQMIQIILKKTLKVKIVFMI